MLSVLLKISVRREPDYAAVCVNDLKQTMESLSRRPLLVGCVRCIKDACTADCLLQCNICRSFAVDCI